MYIDANKKVRISNQVSSQSAVSSKIVILSLNYFIV